MRIKNILFVASVVLGFTVTACEYDNYDAPSYLFSGQLKCDGENFQYDGNKGLIKFIQEGYGKTDGGTGMRVNNEGHYQQLLFNSDYKLTLENRTLPFEFPELVSKGAGKGYDSITYSMSSEVVKDFEVRPYYKLSNLNATLENGNIVATFSVVKMANTIKKAPKIKKAYLYLSTSNQVNSGIKCMRQSDPEYIDDTSLEMYIPLSDYRQQKYYPNNFRTYAFYRVAIELEGIPDCYLFSETKKIENLPLK